MSCTCGIYTYTQTPSGGVVIGGSAVVDSNRRYPSGGVVIAGSATVSTSQTWDTFDAVYHLKEQGNGTAGEYRNSTGHTGGKAANGTDAVNFPTQVDSGIFYKGNSFDGNDYITCPKDTMQSNSPITVSIWAHPSLAYMERVFYSRGFTDQSGDGWQIQLGHTLTKTFYAAVQVIGTSNWITYRATGSTVFTFGCWYHVALVFNPADSLKLYVDGSLQATTTLTETTLAATALGHYFGKLDNRKYADAVLQEARISPIARSASWIAAEAANLCDKTFYNYGAEQNPVYS